MTDNEIRIAIAEACGWSKGHRGVSGEIRWIAPDNLTLDYIGALPDYPNNLNAMHEAEKVFDNEPVDTKSLYWDYLALISMPDPFPGDDTFLRDYAMIRTTARQRAEAFLRTKGLWKEKGKE